MNPSNPWAPEVWTVSLDDLRRENLPMITLGVLNYNRKTELRQTLDVLTCAIQYPNYEIIVVDNGSTDGSIEMVRSEYPTVRVYEVGKNAGVSSRNVMTPMAQGKYLFHFDNDSFPSSPASVLRVVRHLEKYPEIHALSTSCYQPITGIMETEGWEFYRISPKKNIGSRGIFIVEGGVCCRLESLKKVEGYDSRWLYGCEGMDLGIQFFKKNMGAFLSSQFVTLHFLSQEARPAGRRVYMNSRHMIWMIAKHWPLLPAIFLLGLVLVRRSIAIVMHSETMRQNLQGILDGFRGIRPFIEQQPKFSFKQIWSLSRFYLFLLRWA